MNNGNYYPSQSFVALVKSLFFSSFFSNVKSRQFKGLESIQSYFWKTVLKTWLDTNVQGTNLSVPSLLWNNNYMRYQGNVLFFPDWIKGNILNIEDIYGPDGVMSYNEICNKIGNSPNRIIEPLSDKVLKGLLTLNQLM